MRVWLLTVGEPLPTDGENVRLMRCGILARTLAERGHEVLWWTSTLDHTHKTQRFPADVNLKIWDRVRMKLLHAASYRKNISWQRIANHRGVARKFRAESKTEAVPDILVTSFPTLELTHEATEYGALHGVPVIIDVRDLWPDIFVDLAPRWGQWAARALLAPLFRNVEKSFSRASGIMGITPEFVNWGLRAGNRARTSLDRDFPIGYIQQEPAESEKTRSRAFWRERGVEANENTLLACFFGTLGKQFDMEPVLKSIERLSRGGRNIRFVICGDGESLERYRLQASHCSNVLFPGWIGAAEIWTLMRMASFGLAPYVNRFDFAGSLPNKSIEYLSAGLPIVTSLRTGVLSDLLETEECGFAYEDAASLETLLCDLYDNPTRLRRASANATRIYQERFVGERVYSDMCDYLETAALPEQQPRAASPLDDLTRRRDSEQAAV